MKAQGIQKIAWGMGWLVIFALELASPASAEEGDSLWSKTYGGSGEDVAYSLIQTSDGGLLIAGETESYSNGWDIYLVKTDILGDTLWTSILGGPGDQGANSVIETMDGGYLIAGWTRSLRWWGEDDDILIMKTGGVSTWSIIIGDSAQYEHEGANSVIETSDSNYVIAGYDAPLGYLIKLDINGDSLWSHTYGSPQYCSANDVVEANGNYFIAGEISSANYSQMCLIKTDLNGNQIWMNEYGGNEYDCATSIIKTSDDSLLLAGNNHEGGFYLVKTDFNGDALWTKVYGGYQANSVIETIDHGYLLAGEGSPYGPPDHCIWVVKTTTDGDTLWSRTFRAIDTDAFSIIQSGDHYLTTGYIEPGPAGECDSYLLCLEGPSTPVMPNSPAHSNHFVLEKAHPNPFNPTTLLSFQLPVASYVKLEVFDVNGRDVGAKRCFAPASGRPDGSPLQTWYPAGSHQITFDGAGLPSGIYFAKLTAGEQIAVQKLILLK